MNTLITKSKAERDGDSYNKSRKPINPQLGPIQTGTKSTRGIRRDSVGRTSPTLTTAPGPQNDTSLIDKTNIIVTEKST